MEFRNATEDDAVLLFEWANDPTTRAQSWNGDPIAWDDHLAWLDHVLSDDGRQLWIAEVDGVPLGSIRFDVGAGRAVVSVQVDPACRGGGWGTELVRVGTDLFQADVDIPVDAHVKCGNAASVAAFTRAGYSEDGSHRVLHID